MVDVDGDPVAAGRRSPARRFRGSCPRAKTGRPSRDRRRPVRRWPAPVAAVAHLTGLELDAHRTEYRLSGQGRVADRVEQRHQFRCQSLRLRQLAALRMPRHRAHHADGQRGLVAGERAQLPQFLEAAPESSAWTRQSVAHSTVRGAMRIAVRSGWSSGSASATWRARSQLTRAAAISRLLDQRAGAHVPVEAACRSPAASKCSAISAAFSSSRPVTALFDRGGHPPVQFGAVGLELSLVGHRTDQRMVKHILGLPGERDLIDELGRQQVGNDRFNAQCRQQVRSEPRADHRRRAQRSFRFRVEPIDAGGDRCLQRGGTATSAASAVDRYAPSFPCSTPRSASSRTISSAKNGVPAALSAIVWPSLAGEAAAPSRV